MDEQTIPPAVDGQEPCGEMENTQSFSTSTSSSEDLASQDSAEGKGMPESLPTSQDTDSNANCPYSGTVEREDVSVSVTPNNSPDVPEHVSFMEPSFQEVANRTTEQDEVVASASVAVGNPNQTGTYSNLKEDSTIPRELSEVTDEDFVSLFPIEEQKADVDLSDERIKQVFETERWMADNGIEYPVNEIPMDLDPIPLSSSFPTTGATQDFSDVARARDTISKLATETFPPNSTKGELLDYSTENTKLPSIQALSTPPRASVPNDLPQKIEIEPSFKDFRTPLSNGATVSRVVKREYYNLVPDEEDDESMFVPINKLSRVIVLGDDGEDDDGEHDDEDDDVKVISHTYNVVEIKEEPDEDGEFEVVRVKAPTNESQNHHGNKQRITDRFPQTKPNQPQRLAQGIDKNANLNNRLLTVLSEEVNDEIGEDSGDDVMKDERNPASKENRMKAAAEAKKARNTSKRQNTFDSDEGDYLASDQGEEEEDDPYERRNPSSNKRQRKSDDQSKARKNSKAREAKSAIRRARNAPDWHANNRLRPRYKLRDEAWKRAKIEQCGSALQKQKKKKRGTRKAQNFNVSRLLPGQHTAFHDFMNDTQDKDDFHKLKNKDLNELKEDARSFGLRRVRLVETTLQNGEKITTWKMKEMTTALYDAQLIGVATMVEMECTPGGPRGIILADDMGTGKTVQAIGCIVGNPPTQKHFEEHRKTTLIVVPSSLRDQWLEELRKHAGEIGQNVEIFKSSNEHTTIVTLNNFDIVLTTYWELAQSHPSPDLQTRQKWKTDSTEFYPAALKWAKDHDNLKGLLHQVHWYRVILDEGHNIKNHLSRVSRAAVALKAEYRHLMSGTPIMNFYSEFYPLLLFLQEPITMSLDLDIEDPNASEGEHGPEEFQLQYGDATDPLCRARLSWLLTGMILHRKKDDILNGKRIVSLPPYQKKVRQTPSRVAEKILASAIAFRLKENLTVDHKKGNQKNPVTGKINKGDERKRLQNKLASLTRLRQGTANLDIIGQQIVKLHTVEQMEDLQMLIKPTCHPTDEQDQPNVAYRRLSLWIKDKLANTYKWADDDDLQCCQLCDEPSEDLFSIKCGHYFCETCLEDDERAVDDEGVTIDKKFCPLRKECGKPYKKSHLKPHDEEELQEKNNRKRTHDANVPTKGKDVNNFRPVPTSKQLYAQLWLQRFDNNEIGVLPGAKLNATMEHILYWLRRKPADQIIVFSQFRHFQILLGSILQHNQVPFLYFSGDMNHKQRRRCLQYFKEDNNIKVLVAGLKCGGVGLNLTSANRVIVCDLWWNSCIDDQGFGRVYRIGQTKPTYLNTIVVNETVDSKLLEMQLLKRQSIDVILQDKKSEAEYDQLSLGSQFETWDDLKAFWSRAENCEEEVESLDWQDDDDEKKIPPPVSVTVNELFSEDESDHEMFVR